MHRIAASLLIVAAVLALNGGMLREAFAGEPALRLPPPKTDLLQTPAAQSGKILSLLLILEALRQEPASLDRQKV
jgi:hypothetical protein